MTSPECEKILASMNSIIETRTKNYSRILQLRGKLEMMVQQASSQPEDLSETLALPGPSKEALLVYQDDDSSDELAQNLDDMLMPASDTDNEDWDNDEEAGSSDGEEAGNVVELSDDDDGDGEDLENFYEHINK